jgi:flagellin
MGMYVQTNVAAMNAYNNLSITQASAQTSLQRLSSGFRINSAADDAAGLAISEGLRSQTGGLQVAVRNAQDAISVVQTAEGSLSESTAILQRMRDLAVQASNSGSMSSASQADAQTEFGQLQKELDRIAGTTNFNGLNVLDGTYQGSFQVGANAGGANVVGVDLTSANISTWTGGAATGVSSTGLGLSTASVSSFASAQSAIAQVDTAIQSVSTIRANLGAYQNRFQHTINNLNVAVQNLSASESRIRDTDMASEMSNFTKAQILQQAGVAMLAQANQMPQAILKLLG